jgi:hypothetical protein
VIFVEGSDVRKSTDDPLTPRLETTFSEFMSNLRRGDSIEIRTNHYKRWHKRLCSVGE